MSEVQSEAAMLDKIGAMFEPPEQPQAPVAEAQAPVDTETPAEPQEAATDNPEQTEQTQEPEFYEFEFGEAKYQVPKELKELHEGYLRQQDYTRKTQEAAELKRSAELAMQQATEFQAMQQALQPHFEEIAVINQHLKAYAKVDWNALIAQDPTEAQKQFMAQQRLKDMKQQAESKLHEAKKGHEHKLFESRQKLQEEGNKVLTQKIKNWGPEKAQAIAKFATDAYGFSASEVGNVLDARVVEMMHDAKQWRDLQASKPQLQNKAAQVTKTLKPGASDARSAKQVQESQLKGAIRSAKTDTDKEKAIGRLLESRF